MSNGSTMAAPVKPTARPREFFSLAASIDGVGYGLQPVRGIEDPAVERAWAFSKHSGPDATYTVARRRDGLVTCECADYEMRHEGTAGLCKHGRCAVAMGLLDAPSPDPGPRPDVPGVTRPRDEFDAPTQADVRRSIAFGIALPGPARSEAPGRPQGALRPFGEGVADPEAREAPEATGGDPGACCAPGEAEPCRGCVEAPGFADELAKAAGPGPEADAIRLTLAEWLRHQVEHYRLFGTDAALLVADHLAELVTEAEITGASTPGQLRDRRAALASPDDRGPGGAPPE